MSWSGPGSNPRRTYIYYRCERCGMVAAPHQIEAGDDFLPQVDCRCYMGPKWVRGVWSPS